MTTYRIIPYGRTSGRVQRRYLWFFCLYPGSAFAVPFDSEEKAEDWIKNRLSNEKYHADADRTAAARRKAIPPRIYP